jgi:hypothetical protein
MAGDESPQAEQAIGEKRPQQDNAAVADLAMARIEYLARRRPLVGKSGDITKTILNRTKTNSVGCTSGSSSQTQGA